MPTDGFFDLQTATDLFQVLERVKRGDVPQEGHAR